MILDFITTYVKAACDKQENAFCGSFFEQHISLVAGYAEKLCVICNADRLSLLQKP